jgi:hypothetical protein
VVTTLVQINLILITLHSGHFLQCSTKFPGWGGGGWKWGDAQGGRVEAPPNFREMGDGMTSHI